jgi:hypothetical protein
MELISCIFEVAFAPQSRDIAAFSKEHLLALFMAAGISFSIASIPVAIWSNRN